MITFGLSLSDLHRPRLRNPRLLHPHGRHLGRRPFPANRFAPAPSSSRSAPPPLSAYFLMTWATGLWQDQPIELIRNDSFWRAGWGLMAGFFLGGSLPFLENSLGIVTGISLLELGDNTHPLLQELVRRAPGTHNHSITVGSIAEGRRRTHRCRLPPRPHRRLLPRHRQDVEAPLLRRKPGRWHQPPTPSSPPP